MLEVPRCWALMTMQIWSYSVELKKKHVHSLVLIKLKTKLKKIIDNDGMQFIWKEHIWTNQRVFMTTIYVRVIW